MSFSFRDFPASYRYSQTGIGCVFVGLTFIGPVVRGNAPQFVKIIISSGLGLIVIAALVMSNYVVIRYPFLSLVEPEDGDPFSRNFASQGSCLYKFLKFFGLATTMMIIAGIVSDGIDTPIKLISLIYLIILLLFLGFLSFVYDPMRHPTVSTFIRTTLGLGTILFPFLAISIAIGSYRCQRLLDAAEIENEFGMP